MLHAPVPIQVVGREVGEDRGVDREGGAELGLITGNLGHDRARRRRQGELAQRRPELGVARQHRFQPVARQHGEAESGDRRLPIRAGDGHGRRGYQPPADVDLVDDLEAAAGRLGEDGDLGRHAGTLDDTAGIPERLESVPAEPHADTDPAQCLRPLALRLIGRRIPDPDRAGTRSGCHGAGRGQSGPAEADDQMGPRWQRRSRWRPAAELAPARGQGRVDCAIVARRNQTRQS